MAKYRKKPVVIEAAQWFKPGDHDAVVHPVPAHVPMEMSGRTVTVSGGMIELCALGAIKTLEGWHLVTPGDWIITGVQGEHYPCKPDIFAATYEAV